MPAQQQPPEIPQRRLPDQQAEPTSGAPRPKVTSGSGIVLDAAGRGAAEPILGCGPLAHKLRPGRCGSRWVSSRVLSVPECYFICSKCYFIYSGACGLANHLGGRPLAWRAAKVAGASGAACSAIGAAGRWSMPIVPAASRRICVTSSSSVARRRSALSAALAATSCDPVPITPCRESHQPHPARPPRTAATTRSGSRPWPARGGRGTTRSSRGRGPGCRPARGRQGPGCIAAGSAGRSAPRSRRRTAALMIGDLLAAAHGITVLVH